MTSADGTGDGKRLRPLRRHEILHRMLYTTSHPGSDGTPVDHTVQIDASRSDGHAELYVDGRRRATGEMPAAFPVPGGVIEVATSLYGVSRVHLVRPDGRERRLDPMPGTLEHRRGRLRHRHPRLSRTIAWLAIAVLAANLVLAVPAGLEILTRVDRIAEFTGTFTSPVHLPAWLTVSLTVAGVLAAVERALTLRRNRVLDAETLWTSL